ncbi:MAG: hypothetical protein JXR63_09615 [Spirochaetales bacterium]|nr:hypothetical protein [Spirochaetales bacterium]
MKRNFVLFICVLFLLGCFAKTVEGYPLLEKHVDLAGVRAVATYGSSENSRGSQDSVALAKIMESGKLEPFLEISPEYQKAKISAVIMSPVTDDLFVIFDQSGIVAIGDVRFSRFVRIRGNGDVVSVFPFESSPSGGFLECLYDFSAFVSPEARIESYIQFDASGDLYFLYTYRGEKYHSGLGKYSIETGQISRLTPELENLFLDEFAISPDSQKMILSGKVGDAGANSEKFIYLYDTKTISSGYKSVINYGKFEVYPYLFSKDSNSIFMGAEQIFINDDWSLDRQPFLAQSNLSIAKKHFVDVEYLQKTLFVTVEGSQAYFRYSLHESSGKLRGSGESGITISHEDIVEAARANRVRVVFSTSGDEPLVDIAGSDSIAFIESFEKYGFDMSYAIEEKSSYEIYKILNLQFKNNLDYSDISFDGKSGQKALDAVSQSRWFEGSIKEYEEVFDSIEKMRTKNYFSSKGVALLDRDKYSFVYDSSGSLWSLDIASIPVKLFDSDGVKSISIYNSVLKILENENLDPFFPSKCVSSSNNLFFCIDGDDPGSSKILMCSMLDESSNDFIDVLKNVPDADRLTIVNFSASDDYLYFTGVKNFYEIIGGSIDLNTLEFEQFNTDLQIDKIQVYRANK